MSKAATKALIDANITANGTQAITGPILNNVLNTMVDDYGTQEELSQLAQEVNEKNQLLQLEELPGAIQTTTWLMRSDLSHYVIPVNGGETVNWGNTAATMYCAFLTAYNPINGATPDFCNGYIGRQTKTNNASFTLPSDCRYFIISNPNGNWFLSTLEIDGVDILGGVHRSILSSTKDIKQQVEDSIQQVEDSIQQVEDSIQQIEDSMSGDYIKDTSVSYNWVKGVINPDGSRNVVADSSGTPYRISGFIPVTPNSTIYIKAFSANSSTKAFVFYSDQSGSVVDVSESGYTKGSISLLEVRVPPTANYICIQANIGFLTTDLAGMYKASYLPNKSTLDKFSESNDGDLLWNGSPIEGGGESIDIIVDLPVSDGTDILSGYAYIDSSTRNVKVKA